MTVVKFQASVSSSHKNLWSRCVLYNQGFRSCVFFQMGTCYLQEVSEALGTVWAPLPNSELHDVIHNPTAGDSDEFILPVVLRDQDV